MLTGIDCATRLTSATAQALKAAGVSYVGRYLGPETNRKTMQASEAQTILAAGLNLWSIWETDPTRAGYFTATQGTSDAKTAAMYAESVGQPKGTAIYYTVDYDAQPRDYPAVLLYFKAIRAANNGYKVGAYGHYGVLSYLKENGAADYYMQTCAWSNGKVVPFAHIYQNQVNTSVAGISVDRDQIILDPGGWNPMPNVLQLGSTGDAVKTLQTELNEILGSKLTVDGVFGPATAAAVKVFQTEAKITVDGIVGPQTLAAIQARLPKPSTSTTATNPKVQQAANLIAQANSLIQQAQSIIKSL